MLNITLITISLEFLPVSGVQNIKDTYGKKRKILKKKE